MIDPQIPWSPSAFNRCRAYSSEDQARCDLKRNHKGFNHIADHGMHNLIWSTRPESTERINFLDNVIERLDK